MCCFFLHSTISHSTLLFSRSDHCRQWKGVMRELLEVTLQRHFVLERSNSEKEKKKKKTRSPLRPSALTELVGLMYNRSLWPSVMQELTEKYEHKQTECNTPPSQEEAEEDWVDELSPRHDDPLGCRCKFAVVDMASHFACASDPLGCRCKFAVVDMASHFACASCRANNLKITLTFVLTLVRFF